MCGHVEIGEQKDIKIIKRDGSAYTTKNKAGNPGSMMPVVTDNLPDKVQEFRWGLLTAEDEHIHSKNKHARVESLFTVGLWRERVGRKHCVIRVQAYFEYSRLLEKTFKIERADGKPFYIAGLWEHWLDVKTNILLPTFVMITVPPNRAAAAIHDRMPAIMDKENVKHWINAYLSGTERVAYLRSHPCLPEVLRISEKE